LTTGSGGSECEKWRRWRVMAHNGGRGARRGDDLDRRRDQRRAEARAVKGGDDTNSRAMPYGVCSGCGEEGPLHPFGDGMCFLCATDGPPGDYSPAIGALPEDADARGEEVLYDEEVEERGHDIRDIFAEAAEFGSAPSALGLKREGLAIVGDGGIFRSLEKWELRKQWLAAGPRCKWCERPIKHIPKAGPLPEKCSKKCRAAAYAKRKLSDLRKMNQCQDRCGRDRINGSARCASCLLKHREYHRIRRIKKPARKSLPNSKINRAALSLSCKWCENPILIKDTGAIGKFCSKKCRCASCNKNRKRRRRIAARDRHKEWERKHARLQAAREAWLAAGPRCGYCQEAITHVPKTGSLPDMCSKKCRAAAYAKRKLDERRAAALCQDGCGRPRIGGSARCGECLLKQRAYHAARRRKGEMGPGCPAVSSCSEEPAITC
jgi:hypothetical protein